MNVTEAAWDTIIALVDYHALDLRQLEALDGWIRDEGIWAGLAVYDIIDWLQNMPLRREPTP